MRAHKLYFAFWLPITVLCAVMVRSFVHIVVNLPSIPSQGMEALGAVFVPIILAPYYPFIIGFVLCAILRPRLSSLRRTVVIPTILATAAVAMAAPFIPRSSQQNYDVPFVFVDPQGNPVPELTVRYTLQTPQALPMRDYKPRIDKTITVRDGHLTITKERIDQLKLEIEKPAFDYLDVDVGQWLSDVPDYIHKVDISWKRNRDFNDTHRDSLATSLNWRPIHDGALRIVMFRRADVLRSPYPPYTEDNIRELDANNLR